jgi:hypothetical protein
MVLVREKEDKGIPHELPDETQHERLASIHNISPLDPDQMHSVLFAKIHRVIRVFHRLEPGQLRLIGRNPDILLAVLALSSRERSRRLSGRCLGLRHPSLDDGPGKDLIERLKDDKAVFEILKQVMHAGLYAKRVEPQGEHARLALAFRVEVLNSSVIFGFLLVERLEPWMRVEKVCDEGKVQPRIPGKQRGGGQVLPATDVSCVLKDLKYLESYAAVPAGIVCE